MGPFQSSCFGATTMSRNTLIRIALFYSFLLSQLGLFNSSCFGATTISLMTLIIIELFYSFLFSQWVLFNQVVLVPQQSASWHSAELHYFTLTFLNSGFFSIKLFQRHNNQPNDTQQNFTIVLFPIKSVGSFQSSCLGATTIGLMTPIRMVLFYSFLLKQRVLFN